MNLQSRRQRPLGRYFPEIIAAARHLPTKRFVFDGELIIPDQPFDTFSFAFIRLPRGSSCCLGNIRPRSWCSTSWPTKRTLILDLPFNDRRAALEQRSGTSAGMAVSSCRRRHIARKLGVVGSNVWVMASMDCRQASRPRYRPGERAMQKYKLWQTVDCVEGGIYYKRGTQMVEYLLMGLYDEAGRLNYVGRCGDR